MARRKHARSCKQALEGQAHPFLFVRFHGCIHAKFDGCGSSRVVGQIAETHDAQLQGDLDRGNQKVESGLNFKATPLN